ncbi:hypothetical protein NC653_040127 [Populus alba x Populus x berolinensis]|uniref:Uncharacterized protein n=1 Tax=Populus alba x Populus x berolinensis TaxID=444605 RepID=A0AAD6LCX3_9ROSI|nr:hypothetical protein NC653_040127 [Populus alba x Populus x berolinensis]
MSLETFKHLISPETAFSARDTWVSIEKLFLDNVTSRYMHLKSDFSEASTSTRSMSDYLQYVKSTIDSLQANECSLSEKDIITQILHGLLEAYSDVVTVMFDANLCHLINLFIQGNAIICTISIYTELY